MTSPRKWPITGPELGLWAGFIFERCFCTQLGKILATLEGCFECYQLFLLTKSVCSKASYRSIWKKCCHIRTSHIALYAKHCSTNKLCLWDSTCGSWRHAGSLVWDMPGPQRRTPHWGCLREVCPNKSVASIPVVSTHSFVSRTRVRTVLEVKVLPCSASYFSWKWRHG